MFATLELARFAVSVTSIPAATLSSCRRVLIDTLGAAAAGSSTNAGEAARRAASSSWGSGSSPVWFSDQRLAVPGAAFVNAAYSSMLDLDDGHRLASGHPGASIVPGVLALAEAAECTGERLLTAIAIGYEVALRVAASRDINSLRTVDTGRWCGYGVAAAAGWLTGATPEKIAHAMAIVGHTASSQSATGWTKLGHNVKEGIPFATASGLTALHLAEAGYSGPLDILDDRKRYDADRLLGRLGDSWQIERGYFKLYSACRWAHAPIDGALQLQSAHRIDASQIDEIVIGLFGRALTLLNSPDPDSVDGAQYSIPFCVALALLHGSGSLLPITDTYIGREEVKALARKVSLIHRPEMDSCFPNSTPASVAIRVKGTTFEVDIASPQGEHTRPLSNRDVARKFLTLAEPVVGDKSAHDLARLLDPEQVIDVPFLLSRLSAAG